MQYILQVFLFQCISQLRGRLLDIVSSPFINMMLSGCLPMALHTESGVCF